MMLHGIRLIYGRASLGFILRAFADLAKIVIAGGLETALFAIIHYVKFALTIHLIAFNVFHMLDLDLIPKCVISVILGVNFVCFQLIAAQIVKKTST